MFSPRVVSALENTRGDNIRFSVKHNFVFGFFSCAFCQFCLNEPQEIKYVKMYREALTSTPQSRPDEGNRSGDGNGKGNGKGLEAAAHPDAEVIFDGDSTVAENIFCTQRDVAEFVLICAKHLSLDDQTLHGKVERILESNDIVTLESGANIGQLSDDIFHSVTTVIPNLQKNTVDEVVLGIVAQYKYVQGLSKTNESK